MSTPDVTREAAATLEHLEAVRHRTRRQLQSFWFPMALFGAITLLSLPFAPIADGIGAAVFWAVAAPAGVAAIAVHYHRREKRLGASQPAAPYLVTAAAMTVGAFLLPFLAPEPAREVASAFAIAAGYFAFAWIERRAQLAWLALLMAGAAAAAIVVDVEYGGLIAWGVIGAGLLAAGLHLRRSDVAPA